MVWWIFVLFLYIIFLMNLFGCRSAKADPQPPLGGVGSATNEIARLNINADAVSQTEATAKQQPVVSIPECKCGMPLCICESPALKTDAVPLMVWILL